MKFSLTFIRLFFGIISCLFLTVYTTTINPDGILALNLAIGCGAGVAFALLLYGIEKIFQDYSLKSFNIAALGLFFGYLMGTALEMVFSTFLNVTTLSLPAQTATILHACLYLFSLYMGMTMTLKASEELCISIPFIKFKPTSDKKKDVLVDLSVLSDPRMIDLTSSGLFDHHLVMPRFALKELSAMADNSNEQIRAKGKRSMEVLKKLEQLPNLHLRYTETDFPDVEDMQNKLIRLARLNDSVILTSDISRVQQSSTEGIQIINIHSLANALKPISHSGETLMIKIRRYGKEPRQGVGYLDDGTMVVVNGGAEYMDETIEAHVLSVKHTPSGRMIFCNAPDEGMHDDARSIEQSQHQFATAAS
jgi:uncharacterized protein YacL